MRICIGASLCLLVIVAGMVQQTQAAPLTAVDCLSLLPRSFQAGVVDGTTVLTKNEQLTAPRVYKGQSSQILSGGVKMVEWDASDLNVPVIQVSDGSTLCLHNIRIKSSMGTVIRASGNSRVLLNTVDITNATLDAPLSLIEISDSSLDVINSAITDNSLRRGRNALLNITGGSNTTIASSIIRHNTLSNSSTLINIIFPDKSNAAVSTLTLSRTSISNNTAGRLFYAASRTQDASTLLGFNSSDPTDTTLIKLSDAQLHEVYNGTSTVNKDVASLMQRIAARASSVFLRDTNFTGNKVVLELMGLYRVHTQLHNVEIAWNEGVGIPVSATVGSKKVCCIALAGGIASYPPLMPASWRGAVYKSNAWSDTLECGTEQPLLLTTASPQPAPADSSTPPPCPLPVGTRVSGHMMYAYNGTVWMNKTTIRRNRFTSGSLVETANLTSVMIQASLIEGNIAQTVLNTTGVTELLDEAVYQETRFEDEWTRDLILPKDQDSFVGNDQKLAYITQLMMTVQRSAQMYIHGSRFDNNTVYSAVLKAWGTRDGKVNDRKAYDEDSSMWFLKDVHLTSNRVQDIGQPRQTTWFEWMAPSIISWIHVNSTLDNVTMSNNEAVSIVNIQAVSVTVLNTVLQNNTLLPSPDAPVALFNSKWATLGLQNTSFEGNCLGANNTIIFMLSSVHVYLFRTSFRDNILSDNGTGMVKATLGTQITMKDIEFIQNEADRLFYSFDTRHVNTTAIRFINNTGTCMYLDKPKNLYPDSQYSRTNLTKLTFVGNKGGESGVMYVTLNPPDSLAVYGNSTFIDNQGNKGGALVCEQGAATDTKISTLTVEECKFYRNSGQQHGGAISIFGGNLFVNKTQIVNNTAEGTGGAIYADVSQYELLDVIVSGNTAQSAAGLAFVTQRGLEGGAEGSPMASTIKNCTITNNNIKSDNLTLVSPAVLNCGLGGGGGLCLVSPAAGFSDIINTTISSNTARFGGALFIDCGLRPLNQCRTDVTQKPNTVIYNNAARSATSDVAMLSSTSCLRVKCKPAQSDFYNLPDLVGMQQRDCPGWQWPETAPNNVSSLGISTHPNSIYAALSGLQLQPFEGGYKVVSGSAWNATVALHDEAGMDMVEMLDDIVITAVPKEEDLIMITGNHPGAINGTWLSNSTDGELVLSNIITWPSQSDPNNNKYTIMFHAESSHTRFPIKVAEVLVVLPRCTLGEYLISTTHACQTCSDLNSTLPLFSLHPRQRCEPCPENGVCSHDHGMLLPSPDFFQPSFLLPQILRCPIPEACQHSPQLQEEILNWKEEFQNMNATSSAAAFGMWLQSGNGSTNSTGYWEKNTLFQQLQCSPGYKGFLCGACAKNHGRYFGHCQRCLPAWANTIILLLIVAGVFGIVALLTSGHMRKTLRKHAGRLHGVTFVAPMNKHTREPYMNMGAGGQNASSAKGACFALLNITQNLSVQSFEKISHIFKVLTTFVQVNAITRGLQWVAPRQVRQFFTHVDFTSSPGAWISLDCSLQRLGLNTEQVAIARSIFLILLPVFCLVVAYTAWMCCFALWVARKQLPRHSWKNFIIPRLWLSTVQTCYILYPVVTISIFDVFTCDPLNPPQGGVESNYRSMYNGTVADLNTPVWQEKRLWTQNHETVCNTGRHAVLMWALGVPALVFFAVGVPVGLVVLLLTRRHQLQEPKTEMQFGFLYEEYKQRFSYWEAVIMARKVALLVIIIALPYIRSMYRQYVQISSCIVVMMICLLLHITYQPFTDPLLNRLDAISILMTVANLYMLTYWMIPDMSEVIQLLVMVILLCLNTLVIMYFLYHLLIQLRDHKVCGPESCCLKGSLADVDARQRPEESGLDGANAGDVEEACEKESNYVHTAKQTTLAVTDTQAPSDTNLFKVAPHVSVIHTSQFHYDAQVTGSGLGDTGNATPIMVPPPPPSRRNTPPPSPHRHLNGHGTVASMLPGVNTSSTAVPQHMTAYQHLDPIPNQLTQQQPALVLPHSSQQGRASMPPIGCLPDDQKDTTSSASGSTPVASGLEMNKSGSTDQVLSQRRASGPVSVNGPRRFAATGPAQPNDPQPTDTGTMLNALRYSKILRCVDGAEAPRDTSASRAVASSLGVTSTPSPAANSGQASPVLPVLPAVVPTVPAASSALKQEANPGSLTWRQDLQKPIQEEGGDDSFDHQAFNML